MQAAARIGSGAYYTYGGAAFFAFAIFCALAASGGSHEAGIFAGIFGVLGSGLVFVGFWKELFSKLELRLMDVEKALIAGQADTPKTAASSPADLGQ